MNITVLAHAAKAVRAAVFIVPGGNALASPADAAGNLSGDTADIILRTFIGMVFIMVLMWLAAVVAGKLGDKLGNKNSDGKEQKNKEETSQNEPSEIYPENNKDN